MQTSVYKITNKLNGKVYFGKAKDPQIRWYHHKWEADRGKDFPLHRALRKYGHAAFTFEVLAAHETNESACKHETLLIASVPQGRKYNVALGGDGGDTMTTEQLEAQYAIGPEHYDTFLKLFKEGATVRELCGHFQVSENAVKSCALRLNVSFAERRAERKRVRLETLQQKATELQYLEKRFKVSQEEEKKLRAEERASRRAAKEEEKKLRAEERASRRAAKEEEKKLRTEERASRRAAKEEEKKLRTEERTARRTQLQTHQRKIHQRLEVLREAMPPRIYPSKATMTPEERSKFRAQVAQRVNKARGLSEDDQGEVLRCYFEEHLTAQQVADRLKVSKGSVRATVNRYYSELAPEEHARLKSEHGCKVRLGARNPNWSGL